jgi:MerR family mercuric resistance operon transcriptional regulator
MAAVPEIARHHLEDIRAKINDLTKLERLLSRAVPRCSGKRVPDCPVLDVLDVQYGRPSGARRARSQVC